MHRRINGQYWTYLNTSIKSSQQKVYGQDMIFIFFKILLKIVNHIKIKK